LAVHSATPLTLGELEDALTRIGGFEPSPFIAVAVSGGPDSLALVILADGWARRHGGRVWGLTLDHRLRPESAAEARQVGAWLAARDIPHAILAWEDAKPAAGIQEAARAARYRLLGEWCVARGCLHLLTAHHREDQAETYLIRRRAGSGPDGLAAMAAVRELPGLRLVRPLLGVARARLAVLLDNEGQSYLRDPSNRNSAFERSRLRLNTSCDAIDNAVAEIAVNGKRRIERERALAALLARAVALHPAGLAVLDPKPIVAAGEIGEQALGRVARTLGGGRYPLRRDRLARLRANLAATPARAQTLGRCRFLPWRGRVLVVRELARAAPALRLDPGASVLWDGRFAANLPAKAGRAMMLDYLGAEGAAVLRRQGLGDDNPLPRLIHPMLPAVRDAAGLLAVPHLGYRRPGCATSASLAFRPPVSLFDSGFTVA
jgi:tRNA(Ile)-lysidine synthase